MNLGLIYTLHHIGAHTYTPLPTRIKGICEKFNNTIPNMCMTTNKLRNNWFDNCFLWFCSISKKSEKVLRTTGLTTDFCFFLIFFKTYLCLVHDITSLGHNALQLLKLAHSALQRHRRAPLPPMPGLAPLQPTIINEKSTLTKPAMEQANRQHSCNVVGWSSTMGESLKQFCLVGGTPPHYSRPRFLHDGWRIGAEIHLGGLRPWSWSHHPW